MASRPPLQLGTKLSRIISGTFIGATLYYFIQEKRAWDGDLDTGLTHDCPAWLKKKAADPGVVSLPSGLMYKVLRETVNPNAPMPSTNTPCLCHYKGMLID